MCPSSGAVMSTGQRDDVVAARWRGIRPTHAKTNRGSTCDGFSLLRHPSEPTATACAKTAAHRDPPDACEDGGAQDPPDACEDSGSPRDGLLGIGALESTTGGSIDR